MPHTDCTETSKPFNVTQETHMGHLRTTRGPSSDLSFSKPCFFEAFMSLDSVLSRFLFFEEEAVPHKPCPARFKPLTMTHTQTNTCVRMRDNHA